MTQKWILALSVCLLIGFVEMRTLLNCVDLQVCLDFLNDLDSGYRNARTRAKNGGNTTLVEIVVVLGWNNTASNDQNILTTKLG